MSRRTVKFVSAIFISLLAWAPFVTASHGAPAEAEKCLSGPKGAAPAGGHWYYRVDRATKRACWYIGDAKEKVSRAAPKTSPPAAEPASPPNSASANVPSATANARAEWPLPPSRVAPDTSVFAAPRPLATVGAISPDKDPRPNTDDAGAQRPVVGSRWGELAGSSTQANPGPTTDNPASANSGSPSAPSLAAPAPAKAAPTASRRVSQAAAAGLPLATADALPGEKPAGSVQMLLIAILGALALAGLLASAIFRLSGQRRNSIGVDRRVNWHSARTGRPSLSDEVRADRSTRERGWQPQDSLPHELRAADDPDERIAQMLSRLPRSAAT